MCGQKVPLDMPRVRAVRSTSCCTAVRKAQRPRMAAWCILSSALLSVSIGWADARADAPRASGQSGGAKRQSPRFPNTARAPLSPADKKGIVRWLGQDAHATPPLDDYWDAYARFDRSFEYRSKPDDQEGATKAGQFRRKWFFPEGSIGKDTAGFIDVDALGFCRGFRGATRYRVQSLFRAPLTDVTELRSRQGAIAELMAPKSAVRARVANIRDNEPARRWMRHVFASSKFHNPEPVTAEVLYRPPADDDCRVDLKKKKDHIPFLDLCTKSAELRRDFFRDALKLAEALDREDVRSTRLRQLGWLLKNIVHDHSSEQGSGSWISRFLATEDLLGHYDLIDEAENTRTRLGRRIELLREAVSEVLMYAELADYAVERRWTVFPKVLDPQKVGRPILRIIGGRAPRVWRDSIEGGPASVPNTIELNVELGVGGKRHALITGPNNKGKTTTLRLAGQLLTLAQMGLPVPVAKMEWTPMGLNILLRPEDNPADRAGQFINEVQESWHGVLRRARKNPYQLVLMDESATGTIEELREDFGTEYLWELDRTGVLSIYTTHTRGLAKLGKPRSWLSRVLLRRKEKPFFNLHVDDAHRLKAGPAEDLRAFYDGAAAVLTKLEVDADFIERLRKRGRRRTLKASPSSLLRQIWRAVQRR